MRQSVSNRYDRHTDGSFIIDVTATRVEDLYNDFDKSAPYIRRDLNQDLVDYLIECGRELGHESFIIRFSLSQPAGESGLLRIHRSVNAYFLYLIDVEKQKIVEMLRRSAILLSVGLAILFVSVSVNRWLGEERSVVSNVFAEGLTVAAWVSLWEALAVLLIEWSPLRKNLRVYRRLAYAESTLRPATAEE